MHTPGKTCEHCNTPWMQLHSCLLALYSILCDYASKSVSLRIAPILPYPKVQKIGHQRQPNLQVLIKRQIQFAFWRLAICNWSVFTYAHSQENRSALQYTVDAATLPPAGALRHCSRVRFKVCFSTETFQLVLWHCEHDICGKKEVLAYSELLMLKHIINKKWTQKVH